MRVAAIIAAGVVLLASGCGGGAREERPADAAAPNLSPHPAAGDFRPDETDLADCSDQPCYEQALGNVAYYRGPRSALRLFDGKMRTDRAIEAGCHRIAHAIGSAALARYRGNVARAFAEGSPSCWSGYYHGILEHAFSRANTDAKLIRVARGVCSAPSLRRSQWLAYQCVHGLGHGLMLQTGYNLPFSLSVCDRLSTQWDQSSCTGGVFMENVSGAVKSGYGTRSPWVRENNLVYPCDWVKERHKLYCYLMVTSRILQANGYDWRATARTCARVERGWRDECFQSYGRDASGMTRQNARRVLGLCRLAGRWTSECLYGAARDITSNDASPGRAATLCAGAPTASRARCYFGIGTIVGTLEATLAGRRASCARIGGPYARSCREGAGA